MEVPDISTTFFLRQEPGIRQFLLTNLTRPTRPTIDSATTPPLKFRIPIKILARALDDTAGFPFHPDKARFEKPALFIRGTKSHYVPDDVIPLIGRFFPYFRLRDVDAGHWGEYLFHNNFFNFELACIFLWWPAAAENSSPPNILTPFYLLRTSSYHSTSEFVRCFLPCLVSMFHCVERVSYLWFVNSLCVTTPWHDHHTSPCRDT